MPCSLPRLTAGPAFFGAITGTRAWKSAGKTSLSLGHYALAAHGTLPPPQSDTPLSGL